MKNVEQKLIGRHLFIRRGLYSHHGIYVGNDRIIHYGEEQSSLMPQICKTNFIEFCSGQEVFVRVYFGNFFSCEEIVARANSRLGEDEYNLQFNNCEHFASWCITGKSDCQQEDAIRRPIVGLPRAIGRTTLGWAFSVKDRYCDFKMKRFLKSYTEITSLLALAEGVIPQKSYFA
ncbi:MAG: lecithin retinol acyltransferase family protein [Microcoleaceae cyanobacterium]